MIDLKLDDEQTRKIIREILQTRGVVDDVEIVTDDPNHETFAAFNYDATEGGPHSRVTLSARAEERPAGWHIAYTWTPADP